MHPVRPTLVAALLLAALLPAQAGWTELGGNEQLSFYADFDAVERQGGNVSVWALVDAKAPRTHEGKQFSSVMTQFEFQCAARQVRERETRFKAGAMAGGETVASYRLDAPAWEPVDAGSVKEALAQQVCEPAAPDSAASRPV